MRLGARERAEARKQAGDGLRSALRAEEAAEVALRSAGPGAGSRNLERWLTARRRVRRAEEYALSFYDEADLG